MKRMKTAFTLAEVLITLTIIGVVSALTIPTLVQKTNKQEYVSALQKAYSTLSQATQRIIAEEGSPKNGWADSGEHVYELYRKYLQNVKECSSDTGCFPQREIKRLNGNSDGDWDTKNYLRFVLADGIQIAIDGADPACSGSGAGSENICSWIKIDVNGAKKPNQYGRDVFNFVLKEDGLYPRGCDSDFCEGTMGHGCACKVIREGKMDY